MNQIEEVCKDVEKTINLTVQNTLNTLERDCDQVAQLIDAKLATDRFGAWLTHITLLSICFSFMDRYDKTIQSFIVYIL